MKWDDITLWQWQQLQMLDAKKDKTEEYLVIIETISILTNKTKDEILELSKHKIKRVIDQIQFLYLDKPNIRSSEFIKIGNRKYQFNFDPKYQPASRYIETKYFSSNVENNIHKIGASMITPMRLTWRGWVKEEYDSKFHEEYSNDLLSAPFVLIFGNVQTWLKNIKSLDGEFKGLFNKEKEEEEDTRVAKGGFMKNYGWIYQAALISEFEKIKLDEVFNMPTIKFLNDLSYLSAKSSYEAELRKQSNGK
jgi:hypothetical protein